MAKFVTHSDESIPVRLEPNDEGVYVLIGGYAVLLISNRGVIERISSVSDTHTGLTTDRNGRVIFEDDTE